jgi:hypothetical protein
MFFKAAKYSEFSSVYDLNESAKPNPSLMAKAIDLEDAEKSKDSKATSQPAQKPGQIKLWDLFASTSIGKDFITAIKANEDLYKVLKDKGIITKKIEDTPFTVEEIEIANSGKSSEIEKNKENLKKIGLGDSQKPNFEKITASSEYKYGDYQDLSWDDLKKILEKNNFDSEMDFSKYNIVAIRNFLAVKKSYPNRFTDLLVLMSPEKEKKVSYFPATTVPGETFLLQKTRNWYIANGNANSINPKGLAIVQPGVYNYKIGKHRGSYEALVQNGPVIVNRYSPVANETQAKFTTYSPGNLEKGEFGINIHRGRSSGNTPSVDTHSAGCFVVQDSNDFSTLLSKIKKSGQKQINVALVELDKVGKNFLASLSSKGKNKGEDRA